MKDERKSVTVKLTPQVNQAVEVWMSETSCSRQVAMIGLLVKGAKGLGVWSDEPRVCATSFASLQLTNTCSTYDEGTTSTRRVSATSNEESKEENATIDTFSEFWYSIPKQFKRGLPQEAKKKWNSRKVTMELRKSGLTPADVAKRYVAYFKEAKGEGYVGRRYVKHVSNWLDAFGFHDETTTQEDAFDGSAYDLDLTQTKETER